MKQGKIAYTHGNIVNIYIVYELNSTLNNFDTILENCLFGSVRLTKNTEIDNNRYSGMVLGLIQKESLCFLIVNLLIT